jgi:choline dehydrogenase
VIDHVAGIDEAVLASDSALAAYVRSSVDTFCHALGTARMGSADDAGAVVDEWCRVRGVDNLWVVDASVIPVVPRVPPHLMTIMIGERVADWLKWERGGA